MLNESCNFHRTFRKFEKSGDKIDPKMVSRLLGHARTKAREADNLITDILEAGRGANAQFRTQRQKIQFDQL